MKKAAARALAATRESSVMAVSCLATYWLVTTLLSRLYSPSRADALLGGLWAMISTLFVLRESYQQSIAAAVSRMSATLVSFVLCLVYLAFLPFHLWALAVLVGASALAVILLGRPGDATTAGITTTVVLIVAAISPQHAWQQPILRLADTFIGVAVGVLAAWVDLRVIRDRLPAMPAGNQTRLSPGVPRRQPARARTSRSRGRRCDVR